MTNYQKLSNAHPQKTFLTELLEHYPNTPLTNKGTPDSVCPFDLGLMSVSKCDYNCVKCWNQTIPTEDDCKNN